MSFEAEGIPQLLEEEVAGIYEKNKGDQSLDEYLIMDVREPHEYEAEHIPGVTWIPMGEVPDSLGKLDRNKKYVVVCHSGGRSQAVARFMKEQGFPEVFNFNGGMMAWHGEVERGIGE